MPAALFARLICTCLASSTELSLPHTDAGRLPTGRVTVELCEANVPSAGRWPLFPPPAADGYETAAFGFERVPHKYIDTGIRADRPNPYLLRASARVELPAGEHRLLLRSRGMSRLIVDGRVVATVAPSSKGSDGHDASIFKSPPPDHGPDVRFAPPGTRDQVATFRSPGGAHVVVLETLVGGRVGKSALRRPELGETAAAVSREGSQTFELIGGAESVPLTDAGWAAYTAREEAALTANDDHRRAAAFQSEAAFWNARRDHARRWLASTPETPVPPLPAGFPAHNAVDHFLAEKFAASRPASDRKGSVEFARDVQPILAAKCYSCHQGGKAKGDLRLDAPSDAVVAGDPAASSVMQRVTSTDADDMMPPKGDRLTAAEVTTLKKWIEEGASWQSGGAAKLTELTDDLAFLRRVTLDTVGVVPTPAEVAAFQGDAAPDRRARAIDRLLADPRRADHWVGYWQDVLAENPNILNPTLNNTGPFRWWLYEAFRDAKPFDVVATELVRMRGSDRGGGPAGFGVASGNDVPMAEKAVVITSAFLGANMKCARCHDAPANRATQRDLFQIAGMLADKSLKVPKTSSVPLSKLPAGRKPLISVTLKPDTVVDPRWPLQELMRKLPAGVTPPMPTTRDRLAAALTVPENERFAQSAVNRVWRRLMGRGIVEPVDDWERGTPSHPRLLRYLGREFVRSGYDLRHVERLILNSHAYQRAADPARTEPDPLYAATARRRLSAEQIVDSLFAAAGKRMNVGELSLDLDGIREAKSSISLGEPGRAWQFTSTSNERDRPSLALPRAQAVIDLLEAFGWRPTRPDALTVREAAPNVLQPAVLANGTAMVWLTRLSDDHAVTKLALEAASPEALAHALYLRTLTRPPTSEERTALADHLRDGFDGRVRTPVPATPPAGPRVPPRYVSWSNHLIPEATTIKQELEVAARRGDPPTERLDPEWRARLEDGLWALLNAPEFVFTP